MQPSPTHWYYNTVLYQVYPRSFYDSNSDGIGDLEGVRQKLDYLKDLGIGAIWLSPFFPSPMADFGYDVSNYEDVDPIFGSLEDFKTLLKDAHDKNIKVVIDFIPNHCSDQHPWFKESISSRDNPRRDWYTWRDPAEDGGPPNNWVSVFGGPAWQFDEASGQYYLHSFLKEQPDLNWENAGVRAAICSAAKFWLELGIDGFRIDTMYWISKDPQFRNDPINPDYHPESDNPYDALKHRNSHYGPKLFRFFNEFVRTVKAYPDKFVIIEAFPEDGDVTQGYLRLYEHVDPSICAPFNFEGLKLPWKASEFEDFVGSFESFMEPFYLPIFCVSNHDQHRISSRIGPAAARTMAMMQLTLPGLPIIYYGDEIGMADTDIPPGKVQDPLEKQVPGKGLGRDPERTPMQWTQDTNAGFSSAEPWLPINQGYMTVNATTESEDSASMLELYKSLISLRSGSSALKHGTYKSHTIHRDIFCYQRSHSGENLLIILNFSADPLNLNHSLLNGKLIQSTDSDRNKTDIVNELLVSPNEGIILQL